MKGRKDCACRLMHEHGTRAMYDRHACRCLLCRTDNAARADAYRKGRPPRLSNRWVDPTPSIRKLQALAAIGVPRRTIATHMGVTERHVQALRDGVHERMRVDTVRRVDDVYELLWDAPAHMRSRYTSGQAAVRGYLPPMAIEDLETQIDKIEDFDHKLFHSVRDDEAPKYGDFIDEIAVERAMNGERIPLTRAEMSVAIDTLTGMGYSAEMTAERLGISDRTVQRQRAKEVA